LFKEWSFLDSQVVYDLLEDERCTAERVVILYGLTTVQILASVVTGFVDTVPVVSELYLFRVNIDLIVTTQVPLILLLVIGTMG